MARFGRQHEYRIGRALLLAFVVIVVGGAFFPVGILRLFSHPAPRARTTDLALSDPWIRLIPTDKGPLALNHEQVLAATRVSPNSSPEPDQQVQEQRRVWTFDPTTPFRTVSGLAEPMAPASPDSTILHAEFLNSLRLGNMWAALALLDTTRTGSARRQFADTDRWVNRYLGPAWEAEGYRKRQADLWWRAVGEFEAEASH
jgi:hypothetical protein